MFQLEFSDVADEDFSITLALPWLFFFCFEIKHLPIVHKLPGVRLVKGDYNSGEREIYIGAGNWTLRWRLWAYPYEGKRQWNQGWFNLPDFLFGRQKYSESPRQAFEGLVGMPEGFYKATVELYIATWKRPRWPWSTSVGRSSVEVEGGVPVPGKGDNSWDLDDDALFASTGDATSVHEAVAEFRESVMRDRLSYAGEDWVPDKGWPAHCVRD